MPDVAQGVPIHPMLDPIVGIAEIIVDLADGFIPDRPFQAYQREFALAVCVALVKGDSEELTALFCRQSGKTESLARLEPALAIVMPYLANRPELPQLAHFKGGIWIGVFAPVKEQASTSFERMVGVLESPACMALMRACGIKITESNKSSRVLSNGSFIRIWSASPGSNIESKTLHLAVIEEAQDVTAYKIRKSIEPMLTSTSGTMVMIGTANGLKSLFYETIQLNKKINYQDATKRLHFEYDWKTVIQYNQRYRSFLNSRLLKRGKQWLESDEFKMAYGCIFMLERGQFCGFARILELEELCKHIARGPYDDAGNCVLPFRLVAGIDWGKSSDSTVVTVIAKCVEFCQVVDWLEIVGDDYDSQFESIITWLAKFPMLDLVMAETNGVGDPMVDRLKKAARTGKLKATVRGFLANEANNSAGYKNLLTDFVNADRLLIPADEESKKSLEYDAFIGQLSDVTKEWKGSLLKVKAPELSSGEGDGVKHDDYISSLMIAYWAASKESTASMFDEFYDKGKANARRQKNVSKQSSPRLCSDGTGLDVLERIVPRWRGLPVRRAPVQIPARDKRQLRRAA